MSVILNRTPSVQGATGLPRMGTLHVATYGDIQQVYKYSVHVRELIAKWWISMSVILNVTAGVQGATGIPRICTLHVATYGACRHLLVHLRIVGERKFC